MRIALYITSLVAICVLTLAGYLVFGLFGPTSASMIGIGAIIAVTMVYMAAQRTPEQQPTQPLRAKPRGSRMDPRIEFEMTPAPLDDTPQGRARLFEDHLSMARNLIRSERYKDAVDILETAIEIEPEHSKAYNYMGIAMGRLQRYEESAEAYQKAVNIDYDYASAHFNLALVYEQMSRNRDALECWRRYVSIGEVTGEREDMLDRARARIKELS
ncbi:MAG: tetratricopeptide repeat protein [Candidatus Alcyoniella australis]|nr:tetratricopeptide repeat protein [Candidatus Alcyoniella australis]